MEKERSNNEKKIIYILGSIVVALGIFIAVTRGGTTTQTTEYEELKRTVIDLRENSAQIRKDLVDAKNISQELRETITAHEQTIKERERVIREGQAIVRERESIISERDRTIKEFTEDAKRRQKLAEIANQLNVRVGDSIDECLRIIREAKEESAGLE